jgi:hypothetical protein
MAKPKTDRIAVLEDELKQRDTRIRELRADLDKAEALVSEMREHAEDRIALIDSWIEAFDMVLDDDGKWKWRASFVEGDEWFEKYNALLREWNRFVGEYNAVVKPRNVGRPLAASEAQVMQVRKLHKAGRSLRWIAEETSLGVRTVRTIVEQKDGRDRTTVKHLERIDPDRQLKSSWRARKRVRDGLPKRINETLARGRELVKAAKGLGR